MDQGSVLVANRRSPSQCITGGTLQSSHVTT